MTNRNEDIHARDAEVTRTTGCPHCFAPPNTWCKGRSRYHGIPFVPVHPHKQRTDEWRARQQGASQ